MIVEFFHASMRTRAQMPRFHVKSFTWILMLFVFLVLKAESRGSFGFVGQVSTEWVCSKISDVPYIGK